MSNSAPLKMALVGNPNSGKSSLFNALTGLNQKVGNFPGVTVDKKTGSFSIEGGRKVELLDLPGTYSLYPKSEDERVVINVLLDPANKDYPDLIVVVVDASNLKRNLLIFTEVLDLGIPTVLALNMMDEVEKDGVELDINHLKQEFGVEVVPVSAREGTGIDELKTIIAKSHSVVKVNTYSIPEETKPMLGKVKEFTGDEKDYVALQVLHQSEHLGFLTEDQKQELSRLKKEIDFDSNLIQVAETLDRYQSISQVLLHAFKRTKPKTTNEFTSKLDQILTHKIWGLPIFFAILFVIFQGIFSWATYPMDWIDWGVTEFSGMVKNLLPAGWFNDLLTDGVIAGIGGVVIFIPQIAILFAFIAIMEETGYMARVSYISDRLSRVFGLNGKSIVPLVSSVACAVPAIMSARNIDNWKDRLITIFVSPFISCSARIPVYTLLIAVAIPEKYYFGVLNLQGMVMFGLYFLGLLAALFTALALKFILKTSERSYFVMELPVYRMPRWGNVFQTILSKVKTFVFEAGKVIMIISVLLWFLASFGQGSSYESKKEELQTAFDSGYMNHEEYSMMLSSAKLEDSYAGKFGKLIEPAIKPLGFDWRIGIALVTSFAAREVFVGTMATIYSVGDDADEATLKERLKGVKNRTTGEPMFTLAVSLSLVVFYVFAMQCMSTLAVVRRETKGWKWPILQTVYMTGLAYISSLLIYQFFK